jgi:hypothetical protein
MRKDVEEEALREEEAAVARPAAAPRPRMEEEPEMEDKDLLGESTLAKLGGKHETDEEELA